MQAVLEQPKQPAQQKPEDQAPQVGVVVHGHDGHSQQEPDPRVPEHLPDGAIPEEGSPVAPAMPEGIEEHALDAEQRS